MEGRKGLGFNYFLDQWQKIKLGEGESMEEYLKKLEELGRNPGFEYFLNRWNQRRVQKQRNENQKL